MPDSTIRATPSHARPPIEIIDVDLLDDDEVQTPRAGPGPSSGAPRRPPQPASSSRETISLLDDSDDEVEIVEIRRPSRPLHRERLFSPPPPAQLPMGAVPPVPRIPSRYAAHTGYPVRRRAADLPVLPANRDFGLEPPPPRRSPSQPVAGPSTAAQGAASTAPRAAPRSHHVPSLGLGGALIAHNRPRIVTAQNGNRRLVRTYQYQQHIPPPYMGGMHEMWLDDLFDRGDISIDDIAAEFAGDFLDGDRPWAWRGRPPLAAREQEHYRTAYTHPAPPEDGFTHNFEQDEAESPAATSAANPIVIKDDEDEVSAPTEKTIAPPTMTLVCARCDDPMVLNSALNSVEAIERKIWGLRCGHLIDGKCLHEIGQPPVMVDRKGKGKAKAAPSAFLPYGEEASHAPQDEGLGVADKGMRSKLRSRDAGKDISSRAVQPGPVMLPYGSTAPVSPVNNRKRKRGTKASTANKKAKIEEEYEWECPVATCRRTHVSVKINGVWGPEKERPVVKRSAFSVGNLDKTPRGPIAVFA